MMNNNRMINKMGALYRWQKAKVIKWIAQMSNPRHDGLIGMATEAITGTGKTLGSISCAQVWFDKHGSKARLIIVVPSSALMSQWYDIMVAQGLGNVSRQGNKKSYDGFSPVVITTQNSLKHVSHHRNMHNKQVMYILDEAHKCAAEGCMKQLNSANNDGFMQAVLAVSGTLNRSDGRCIMDLTGFDGYIKDAYGKNIRKPHIRYGYRQALKDDVIPPFKIHIYQMSWGDMTWQEQSDYHAFTKEMAIHADKAEKEDGIYFHELRLAVNQNYDNVRNYNFTARKRKRLVDTIEMRFTLAMEILMKHGLRGDKVICMHTSIAAITRLKNQMIEGGLETPYIYHSGESIDYDEADAEQIAEWKSYNKNRSGILKEWLDPRTDSGIMLSVKALTEGIDVPELDANFMIASNNTHTPILQSIGRSLRGNKNEDGVWIDRFGQPIEHKDIYIIVQGGTTDADKLMYVKQGADIPDECFTTYTRHNDEWKPQTGANIEITDDLDSLSLAYYDNDVISYDMAEDEVEVIIFDDDDDEVEVIIYPNDDDDEVEVIIFDDDTFDSPVVFDTTTGEFVPKDKTNRKKGSE